MYNERLDDPSHNLLPARVKPADCKEAADSLPRGEARFEDHHLYLNPELSLLQFQRRVLEEARDPRNPLLERVKFLAIVSSNLDEFFMVRVAGLLQQIESGVQELSIDGIPPGGQLEAIRAEVLHIVEEVYEIYREDLLPALAESSITIAEYQSLAPEQRRYLEAYFWESVYPVLTPLAFDRSRPFPHISNLSLNLAVVVRDAAGAEHFARVKVPDSIGPLVPVSDSGQTPGADIFVWLEEVILANLHFLFPGLEIVEAHPFHVTRDAEVSIKEIETDDLLATIEEAVWQRRFRDVVRLVVNANMPEPLLDILTSNLEIDASAVYRVTGPLNFGRLRHLTALERPDLKDRPFLPHSPALPKEEDFFAAIRQEDILLHHPFDSFQPVVDFLQRAARDPAVLAIKMTLYRLGRDSPVVDALLEAVNRGKQVAVVVELQARFDEESNIEWARALEREGVHVVHGLPGLKVHSKVALVVRREGDVIRRYLHLATGNYNPITARLYTDMGMFTCDPAVGADATALFNYLTGYSTKHHFSRLLVAPVNLRERLTELIEREIEHQRSGRGGLLIFKMNGLDDPEMIRLLYQASRAGVRVHLLIRGICSLRPGVCGLSENIRVTSIVGRFLEHSRVYYCRNGGSEEIYLGSADLMPRNLNRRVEVLFPVTAPRLVARVRDEILNGYLADDASSRFMHADGTYSEKPANGRFDCQAWFLAQRGARPAAPVRAVNGRSASASVDWSLQNGQSLIETRNGALGKRLLPVNGAGISSKALKVAELSRVVDLAMVRHKLERLRLLTRAIRDDAERSAPRKPD